MVTIMTMRIPTVTITAMTTITITATITIMAAVRCIGWLWNGPCLMRMTGWQNATAAGLRGVGSWH